MDDEGSSSFGSTSSMHCLSIVSDLGVEFRHKLHSDRTVAALLRHLRAKRLRELLADDAKGFAFTVERGKGEPGKHYRSDGHVAHVAGSVSNGGSLGSSFSGSTPSLRRDQFHSPRY